jgi:hypothetical protein
MVRVHATTVNGTSFCRNDGFFVIAFYGMIWYILRLLMCHILLIVVTTSCFLIVNCLDWLFFSFLRVLGLLFLSLVIDDLLFVVRFIRLNSEDVAAKLIVAAAERIIILCFCAK